jgi:TonB family protein
VPPRSAVYQPAPTNLPVRELLPPPALTARLTDGLERLPLGGETPAEPAPATSAAPPAETTVEILGPLAGRRLVVVPPLPRAPGPAAVRRSRVWIAVGPDGRVRHAVLERASGNEPLDQLAVDLARQLEFERQISPDPLAVTWGIARFVWAVSHDAGNAQGPAAGHPGRR